MVVVPAAGALVTPDSLRDLHGQGGGSLLVRRVGAEPLRRREALRSLPELLEDARRDGRVVAGD